MSTIAAVIQPLSALTSPTSPEIIEGALRRVAQSMNGSDPLRRSSIRESAITIIGGLGISSPAKMVDAAFAIHDEETDASQGKPVELPVIEPWSSPVDGAAVLDEVAATFRRFVAFPEHADTTLALWAAHAHAESAAFVSPILCLTSPTKQCGKTTTLTVMSKLVPKPLVASNITSATVFRTVEKYTPTLLIDEGDTFIPGDEGLRGILNSGHTRSGAQIIRLVPKDNDYEPRTFSTWCPKLIALIKQLPSTLEDRSIVVPHRRRAKGERVQKMRLDRLAPLEPVARRLARWVTDQLDGLKRADPAVPDALGDRAADNWRPLLAIADAAGGAWPEKARKAALALSLSVDDPSIDVLVLAALQDVWPPLEGSEFLSTEDLLAHLNTASDQPWSHYGFTAKRLAMILRGFGIRPVHTSKGNGYKRADFEDAWGRWLTEAGAGEVEAGA